MIKDGSRTRSTSWKTSGPNCFAACSGRRAMTKGRIAVPLLLVLAISAAVQHHRDPLTDPEINKVRDAAQLPEIRLKLYVEFARARLDKLRQVHSDPKATDRTQQTRDALQAFL